MRSSLSHVLNWIIVAVFLLSSSVSASAGVLCLGDDGDVKVETICSPQIEQTDDDCCGSNELEHSHEGECEDCCDVVIAVSALHKRMKSIDHLSLHTCDPISMAIASGNSASISSEFLESLINNHRFPQCSSILLRSTVLLC